MHGVADSRHYLAECIAGRLTDSALHYVDCSTNDCVQQEVLQRTHLGGGAFGLPTAPHEPCLTAWLSCLAR